MERNQARTEECDERWSRRRAPAWRLVLSTASLAMMTWGSGAAAGHSCGATITSDLKLEHDLVCTGDAIIVGGDGITLDLNGHTVAGSGAGAGISITGRSDVTIRRGVIRDFAVGIRMNTATDVDIRQNRFTANGEAVDLQAGSVGNRIKDNTFEASSIRAIMLRSNSRDNTIEENVFSGNRIGVLLFGAADSEVKENLFTRSEVAGIRVNVLATGNTIRENTIDANAAGVEFLVTPTGSATGNELRRNRLTRNACALKGPTEGNALRENFFEGNGSATCS